MRHLRALLATAVLVWGASPSSAENIFLSGDLNIVSPLDPVDVNFSTGNQQFFQNILSGGNSVVVDGRVPAVGLTVEQAPNKINTFYNSLAGVSSGINLGVVTAATLAGADLYVGILPNHSYAAGEIAALSDFLAGGGNAFFLGENDNIAFLDGNTRINEVLAALGSDIEIDINIVDPSIHQATGSQIAADPFTNGVSSLTYGGTSSVSGGTTLFSGTGGEPFIAYQSVVVPEPSSFAILIAGAVGVAVGAAFRRRWQCST